MIDITASFYCQIFDDITLMTALCEHWTCVLYIVGHMQILVYMSKWYQMKYEHKHIGCLFYVHVLYTCMV